MLLLKLVSVAYFTAIDIETVMKSVMFLYYNVNITVKIGENCCAERKSQYSPPTHVDFVNAVTC